MTVVRIVSYAFLLVWAILAPRMVLAQQAPADPDLTRLFQEAQKDADGYLYLPLKTPAPGATPEETKKNEQNFAKAKTQRVAQVRKYLMSTDEALPEADQAIVKNWFYFHEFRVLTQTSPKELEQLPAARFDFFKQWIYPIKHSANHQMMIDLTLGVMQQIVLNDFHPVVRYNAMLIIGDLNEQEVVRFGANPRLPEPYSAALPFIIDRIENANSPDIVRVAALVGLIRHLEWEPYRSPQSPIPPGTRTQMVNTLLKLATMKEPPPTRTAEGHLWMRRRALEGLGLASVTTAQPEVVTTIETILKDNAEPLQLRFAAALALGRTNVPAGYKIDSNELARTLGMLAATGIKSEFERLEKMDKDEAERRKVYETLGESGTPGVGPGYGSARLGEGMPTQPGYFEEEIDPKSYRLDPLRKRLRYELFCIQTCLGHTHSRAPAPPAARKGALKLATSSAEKKAVEDILDAVNKLALMIEKNKNDYAMLKAEMKTGAKTLETTVAKFAPAPAPAAPGAPMPKPPASLDDELLDGPVRN
jgi:hypothetical protein